LSRDHEQPSDESEFSQSPGAISWFTSQVPGPKGSSGEADGGVRICVHHPHPSDENAASDGATSTVKYDPEPAIVSVEPSIEDRRFQEHARERMARQIPDAISSPTSQVPLLNVPLASPGDGALDALGVDSAPAAAGLRGAGDS
jgi:hypothetical protein